MRTTRPGWIITCTLPRIWAEGEDASSTLFPQNAPSSKLQFQRNNVDRVMIHPERRNRHVPEQRAHTTKEKSPARTKHQDARACSSPPPIFHLAPPLRAPTNTQTASMTVCPTATTPPPPPPPQHPGQPPQATARRGRATATAGAAAAAGASRSGRARRRRRTPRAC
jgi:hypothetical protein